MSWLLMVRRNGWRRNSRKGPELKGNGVTTRNLILGVESHHGGLWLSNRVPKCQSDYTSDHVLSCNVVLVLLFWVSNNSCDSDMADETYSNLNPI